MQVDPHMQIMTTIPFFIIYLTALIPGHFSQDCPTMPGLASPALLFQDHIQTLLKLLSVDSPENSISLIHFSKRNDLNFRPHQIIFSTNDLTERSKSFTGILALERMENFKGSESPYVILKYIQSRSFFDSSLFGSNLLLSK